MPEIPEPDWITLAEARRRALAHFDDAPHDTVELALTNAFWEKKSGHKADVMVPAQR